MSRKENEAIKNAMVSLVKLKEKWPINLDKSFLCVGIEKLEGFIINKKVDKDEKV